MENWPRMVTAAGVRPIVVDAQQREKKGAFNKDIWLAGPPPTPYHSQSGLYFLLLMFIAWLV